MRARCRCFSVCSRAEATAFLDGAPRTVEAWTDPWVGYLRTVYGSRLARASRPRSSGSARACSGGRVRTRTRVSF